MADATTKDMLKESFSKWKQDEGPRLAAALTYYTVFSLAPLLIVLVGIAGLFLGQNAAKGQLSQLQGQVGGGGGQVIQGILQHASKPSSNYLAAVVGFVVLLFGASGVFVELRDALNKIWEVPESKLSGLSGFLKGRLVPFFMILGIGVLLLAALAVGWAIAMLRSFATSVLPLPSWAFQIFQFVASVAVITVLFAIMYVVLPEKKIAWKDVWLGAFVTAVLFSIGKTLIGVYLGSSTMASPYGAAASLVLFLFWLYYSAQIFYYGAAFTYVHARHTGGAPKVRTAGGR